MKIKHVERSKKINKVSNLLKDRNRDQRRHAIKKLKNINKKYEKKK